ncbi:MAG TPA: hypothetical protein VLG12_06915 [Candidatus Saccharimonadales bacterium]|nr:hypothetical protein [Candidatus Saccharimonadales bacterium]
MSLLITFLTIVFLFIAFLVNPTQESNSNFFYTYYSVEFDFIWQHAVIFSLSFIVITVLFIRSLRFDKHYSKLKNYTLSLSQVIAASIIGFCLSFIFLLLIALVELNILSVLINVNPHIVGIETNSNNIVKALKINNQPPQIIASDNDQHKELVAVANATTGTDNFYGKYILSSVPKYLITPISNPKAGTVLLDNTLIITQSNQQDLQTISPVLGYLFVQRYFPTRPIKSFPKVTIMKRQEYLKYRGIDYYKKITKIDKEIATIEDKISSISAIMKHDKNKTIAEQNQLDEYQYYDTFFKTQRNILQNQKRNIPHELGDFEPKDAIKIVIDTTSSHAIADYLETVTHEYLHYASYVKGQSFSNSFFEEGLTEYFARRAIKDDLHISTNLGYPVFVKIITEMTKLIPESELADIYFSQDENNLEEALNRVYGDNFYEDNYVLFDSLQYTSDPHQIVKIANDIMKKIGGSPLKEKDLISTYSSL